MRWTNTLPVKPLHPKFVILLVFRLLNLVIPSSCLGQDYSVPTDYYSRRQRNPLESLEQRVGFADLEDVRQIASTCFQQYHQMSDSVKNLKDEIQQLRSVKPNSVRRDTMWYFNHPLNHDVSGASTEDISTDMDASMQTQNIPNKARAGIVNNINPSKSNGGTNQRSSSKNSRNPKASRSKSKQSSEEDEAENPADFVPNPGILDSNPNNKPKNQNDGHRNSKHPSGKVIFEETFEDRNWDSKWMYTKYAGNGTQKFERFFRVRSKPRQNGKSLDYGIMTSNKGAEDYAVAASFSPLNSNEGTLVIQFSVLYQTPPYCEYVFLRLFDCKFQPEDFHPETSYLVQLGPDFCGNQKNEISVVMSDVFKSERRTLNQQIMAVTSTDLHMYALIIDPGGNYQVLVNNTQVQNGTMRDQFPNFQGFPSICSVGLSVWHSVLDKFFKGQIILDDVLISTDVEYAEKKRVEILGLRDDKRHSDKDRDTKNSYEH